MERDTEQRNPFEQLQRSHRRLEERLADLDAATAAWLGGSREALATCDEVLGFLERAVARHERDEEESLFPRLATCDALTPTLAALAGEHRTQRALVDELAGLLAGRPDAGELRSVAERLAASYRAHILVEERDVFPVAEARLTPSEVASMAAEMEGRRGGARGGGGGGGGGGRRA